MFPNEMYRDIITYVDPITRSTCLTVSRTFREYASEIWPIDEKLDLVYKPGETEPRCTHHTLEDVGPFRLSEPPGLQPSVIWQQPTGSNMVHWHPVTGHQDGTASFQPDRALMFSAITNEVPKFEAEDIGGEPECQDETTFVSTENIEKKYGEV